MADTKLSALSPLAAPSADDLVYVVDDPAGSAVSLKATVAALLAASIGITLKYVRKTADESVTSSAVLQDDDHLTLTIGANETWFYLFWLVVDATTAGDIAATIVAPSGAAGWQGAARTSTSAGGATNLGFDAAITTAVDGSVARNLGGSGSGTVTVSQYGAFVRNGSNAGNVKLQWAQASSNGTASKLLTDSIMIGVRLA